MLYIKLFELIHLVIARAVIEGEIDPDPEGSFASL